MSRTKHPRPRRVRLYTPRPELLEPVLEESTEDVDWWDEDSCYPGDEWDLYYWPLAHPIPLRVPLADLMRMTFARKGTP